MTLSELRKKLVQLSGRYDLVVNTSNYTDDGANFWLQAGQRWLDRQLSFGGEFAELSVNLATGATSFTVSAARAIKDVGIKTGDSFKFLDRREYEPLKRHTAVTTGVDKDEPRYWAIGVARTSVAMSTTTPATPEILVWPPTDQSYELVATGLFKSQPLTSDDAVSWWTEEHPDVLLKAALFRMEAFQRNTAGERDYRQSLLEDVEKIDFDVVEQQVAGIDRQDNLFRWVYEPPSRTYER